MNARRAGLALAFALCVLAPLPARAGDWASEAAASRLEFATTFEKTPVPGVFKTFAVRLAFDPVRPGDGRLDVTIDVTSADMGSAEVNNGIARPEWFDFARYPQAEFHAAEIRRVDANRYVARGILRLKGVQQALEVPFEWTETAKMARLTGGFSVKRSAFGIGTGEWAATSVIGAEVSVRYDLRLLPHG